MDWAGWALFGLVSTAVLTALMIAAQLLGWTRLDLPLMLGTIVTEDPDHARVFGFFMHLAIGEGFALGYAATFALLDNATWWLGALVDLATPLGLFAEELDPDTGAHLGNFPQVLTHAAFVRAALELRDQTA